MNNVEKFSKILGVTGGIATTVGFLYILSIAGVSDTEQHICEQHSFDWLVNNLLIGLSIFMLGCILLRISDKLSTLSYKKKYRRVWIRNIVSNKTTSRLVEDGSDIILSDDEVIYRVGRKVCRF